MGFQSYLIGGNNTSRVSHFALAEILNGFVRKITYLKKIASLLQSNLIDFKNNLAVL